LVARLSTAKRCSRIRFDKQPKNTTLAKAKAIRPLAEKMVTLGKRGSIHARRTALATLRQKNAIKKLFDDIAPRSTERNGGYTRIVKLGQRKSDSAPMAFIEWVDAAPAIEEKAAEEKKAKRKAVEPAAKQKEPAPQPEALVSEEKEPTPAPAEEPKPKKRKWFSRKSAEPEE
jgi:large subunit ribosomal protein L17